MIQGYLIYFILLIIGLWITGLIISGDIFSPVSIFCLVFLFSSFCALYSTAKWNFSMSYETFRVLSLGVVSFFIPSVLFHAKMRNKRNLLLELSENDADDENLFSPQCKLVEISRNKAIFTIFTFVVCTAVYFYFLSRAVGGGISLSRIASAYRTELVSGETQISFVGRLMILIIRAIANVLVCIVINNILSSRNVGNHSITLIICCVGYIAITILSGERTSALRFIGIIVLSFSVLWQRNTFFKRLVNIKYIILSVLGVMLLLYAFSAIRYFVGRNSQLDVFDYISMYAGGPIYSFDRFINSNIQPTFTGTKTFVGLYNNLARVGFGELLSIHRDTVIIQNLSIYIGNVYTCFYDYYMDYGLVGMIILIMSYSCIVNGLYMRAKFAERNALIKTIEYTFFSTTLFFASFTEQFFTSYITISTIEFLIILRITYYYLISTSIGFLKFEIPRE